MEVPVVVQAISAEQLSRSNVNDMVGFSSIVPGLTISPASGPVGFVAFLRGVGNGDTASFIDQSILLNVDGMNQSHGSAYRLGLLDLAQIEVLKGPQSLFYGKSATAGIIAIKSADPTPDFMAKVTGEYGFDADQKRVEAVVSGPLSHSLGIRAAGFFDKTKGWLRNANPAARYPRVPNDESYGGRVTLKFDDSGIVRATAKASYMHFFTNGTNGLLAQRKCTGTTAQQQPFGLYDDCQINRINSGREDFYKPYIPGLDYSTPASAGFLTGTPSSFARRDGDGYDKNKIISGVLTLEADISQFMTLTSITGYSYSKSSEAYTSTVPFLGDGFKRRDFSQEVRLATSYDGEVNFLLGALYSRGTINGQYALVANVPGLGFLHVDNSLRHRTETTSAFGQLIVKPADRLEVSLGTRFTRAHRAFTSLVNQDTFSGALDPFGDGEQIGTIPRQLKSITEEAFTPEATVSYRPTDSVMIFASAKKGYKGPGFNLDSFGTSFTPRSATDVRTVSPYGGERVKGVEAGVKGSLIDRTLDVTLTAYWYKYDNLQVSFARQESGATIFITSNAAFAKVQGVEATFAYRPRGLSGLSLNGSAAYNRSRYTSFVGANCYAGQNIARGCSSEASVSGTQDLTGRPLRRAPTWAGQASADYQAVVTNRYSIGFNITGNFSSGYFTTPELNPTGYQKGYGTIDAGIRFGELEDDGLWQIDIIGRNLTNKIIGLGGFDSGGNVAGVPADVSFYTNRPREVIVRLTLRM